MNNLSKMITGLVIAATIVSTGAVAMAADSNTAGGTNAPGSKQAAGKMTRGKGGHKGDIFAQSVSSGILTQEKADAAKAKLQETHQVEEKAALADGLKGLVTAGTITQAQADKISTYIDTLKADKPALGTETADQKKEKKKPLSGLVDDGTLTQTQLDEVSKVIGKGHGHGGHKGQGVGMPVKEAAGTSSTDSNI